MSCIKNKGRKLSIVKPLGTRGGIRTAPRFRILNAKLIKEIRLTVSNAIKLTRYSQAKRKKALDKNEKMCGKALKTRLIFRGAHK